MVCISFAAGEPAAAGAGRPAGRRRMGGAGGRVNPPRAFPGAWKRFAFTPMDARAASG
jgi:hypothetical protein